MKTYAFIDASNLFYGGEKSLGFKIDYKKLKRYLEKKYQVERFLYFGGVETYKFDFDCLKYDSVPIKKLREYYQEILKSRVKSFDDASLILLSRHLQRVKFYQKLAQFGYELYLKPVKIYNLDDGSTKKKANCDVDMTFWMMKEKEKFNSAIILSGDGDFLPVLKYLEREKKQIFVLARGERTAREIRKFAGGNFRDFAKLKRGIEFKPKSKRAGHTKYPAHV
jgi:uncharacterized LabA/DUF88 family protein